MKLMSYSVNGKNSWGAAVDAGVVDLASRSGRASLREALAAFSVDALQAMAEGHPADHRFDDITFLPVITDPAKILRIGTNYHDHRIETEREVPEKPVVFARFANSQVGHGQALLRPPESEQFDFEGEIAIIIGKRGRRIAKADAWEHIAGYAPYCDGTLRDWQRHTHQWVPGKTFVGSGGFGPWMATRGEIADGADLSLITRLNGVEVQRSSADLMIFSIPDLIAYCSIFTELEPGDVIVSGTPGGVGGKRKPPLWMKDGDTLEVEVGQVGVLRCPVKNEAV